MSPVNARDLGSVQESILDGIKRANPDATDKLIAARAGVDRTQLSKWRTGEREMRLTEVIGMQGPYGASTVLGPIAALDEADVIERDPKGIVDPKAIAVALTLRMAELSSVVHLAMADGVFSADELAALTLKAEAIVVDLRRLQAGARDAT